MPRTSPACLLVLGYAGVGFARFGFPGVGFSGPCAPGPDHAPWDVGTRYADTLAERVLLPLGSTRTGCGPDLEASAVGHWHGRLLAPWRIPGLPGAGAVRSTARDLARCLRAHLAAAGGSSGWVEPQTPGLPLARALREVQRPRLVRPRTPNRDELCLVWNLRRAGGRALVLHTGATRGFTAFVGFCPSTGTGLAALANSGPSLDGRFLQAAYDQLKELGGAGTSAGPAPQPGRPSCSDP
ncbi:beta-lactamase family protein [Kitasatospora sp. NBC_01302]|nr:beta-lactamase family protein [Kitasatospora sp. NBC_01302]